MERKPLSGVKILDFTRLFAGPFCTMLLADLGADVVKVEPPEGDPTRQQGPPFYEGQGMAFWAANRNKRSITLNMKDSNDAATARKLALAADVIVENFRPGVMERLGLGYEALRVENPRLIYMTMSGMGASGPYSKKGALDLTIQAEAGYMSLTGERDGKPIKLGTSAFDLVCGQYAVSGVMAALIERERTGRGQRVETSLFEGIITYLVDAGMEWLLTGGLRQKWGSEHVSNVPYKAFPTSDGWIVVAAATQRLWQLFVEALGREDLLRDPRFATMPDRVSNRDVLYEILDAEVKKATTESLAARLDELGVPCAPVNTLDRVFTHPQALARGMKAGARLRDGREMPMIGPAVKFESFDVAADWRAPPKLGEDATEIVQHWLGNAAQTAPSELSLNGEPLQSMCGRSIRWTKTVSEADVYLYAGITGDFSPNHVDETYMKKGRYKKRIAHGTLMVGFMSAAAARFNLGRTVSVGYDRLRFTAPVYFGDTITTEYTLKAVDEARRRAYSDVRCFNESGTLVASATHVRALVD